MAKQLGATDAFNAISLKMDETFIQADEHFRNLRIDATKGNSSESLPDRTLVPSPMNSERSCSPNPSRVSVTSSSSSSSIKKEVKVKTKGYLSLDKKKGVVMISFKSKQTISESDVGKVRELIEQILQNDSSSSSSSIPSMATIVDI